MVIATPFAKITNTTLEKLFVLFDRYRNESPTHLEQLVKDVIYSPINYEGRIERIKFIYLFFSAKGFDLDFAGKKFVSRIFEISDLQQKKELLEFALGQRILPRTLEDLTKKHIRIEEDKINRLI
jgi:hypothetical protein